MGVSEERSKMDETPTSSEQQSKRSRGSASVDVFGRRMNIDLNADTDEIPDEFDDIEEISPPRRPMGRNKAKRAQRHAEKNESRLREHEEMKKNSTPTRKSQIKDMNCNGSIWISFVKNPNKIAYQRI